MSLNKGIEHGKEWRQTFRGSKAVANSCRNHGGCPWCFGNRMHKNRVKEIAAEEAILEFNRTESN